MLRHLIFATSDLLQMDINLAGERLRWINQLDFQWIGAASRLSVWETPANVVVIRGFV